MEEYDYHTKMPTENLNRGLTARLRAMPQGTSIIVPLSARRSLYALAKQIKIKIRVFQELSEDTVSEYNHELGYNIKYNPVIGLRVFRLVE